MILLALVLLGMGGFRHQRDVDVWDTGVDPLEYEDCLRQLPKLHAFECRIK